MFAISLLQFSLVFSAFILAFWAALDRVSMARTTVALALALAQSEASEKLSAFILDNSPNEISTADLTLVYDPTDIPDSTCIFDAFECLAAMIIEAENKNEASTPVIPVVPVKAIGPEDVEVQRAWNGYARFLALNAHYPAVIRPEAQYVASDDGEKAADNADDSEVDDWYARWAIQT